MATNKVDELQEEKGTNLSSEEETSVDGADEVKLNGEMSCSSEDDQVDDSLVKRKRSLGTDSSDDGKDCSIVSKDFKRARLGSPLAENRSSDSACELDSSPVVEARNNCVDRDNDTGDEGKQGEIDLEEEDEGNSDHFEDTPTEDAVRNVVSTSDDEGKLEREKEAGDEHDDLDAEEEEEEDDEDDDDEKLKDDVVVETRVAEDLEEKDKDGDLEGGEEIKDDDEPEVISSDSNSEKNESDDNDDDDDVDSENDSGHRRTYAVENATSKRSPNKNSSSDAEILSDSEDVVLDHVKEDNTAKDSDKVCDIIGKEEEDGEYGGEVENEDGTGKELMRRKRRGRTRKRFQLGSRDGSLTAAVTRSSGRVAKSNSEKLNGEKVPSNGQDSDDDIIEEKRVDKAEPMKRRSMTRKQEEDPDVQAVDPLDPLADPLEDPLDGNGDGKASKKHTIIVNDTKTLVELAAGNKEGSKEPTLVIIDTNSILSGKGPVPVSHHSATSSTTTTTTTTTSSLSSQSVFSIPNIPIHTGSGLTVMPVPSGGGSQRQSPPSSSMSVTVSQASAMDCPGLSDDMFVVEAPSFIVPYVYEKPPKETVKEFCTRLETTSKVEEKDKGDSSKTEEDKAKASSKDEKTNGEKEEEKAKMMYSRDNFFDSSLGKFFMQIGMNLVQEYVQTDLLRAQKRKAERESGRGSAATQHAISSLLRNLEDSKENNEPFHFEMKKCEFCSFKTESSLVMAQHLETPHMRHYTYRCNFCPFETRVPHDILFHMEAEHNVRGRLERAPAFHQCANCSFEDNSKGKLSRHILSCMKKFRYERNQEPPTDWELPAKIYRVSRGRPSTLGPGFAPMKNAGGTLSHPLMPKLAPAPGGLSMAPPLIPNSLHRPRGRPPGPATLASKLGVDARTLSSRSLGSAGHLRPGMIYRPSGSQVYVPSSFSFSNNPIYQVVNSQGHMVPVMTGGLSNVPRLTLIPSGGSSSGGGGGGGGGGPAPVALIPNLTSGASSITIQSASSRTATPKAPQQPSISITPLPRQTSSSASSGSLTALTQGATPKTTTTSGSPVGPKTTFVICEICDGYIKDLEQLRNHMQWIHKVKIHPKMIYNRPPLNCQKCQFRFFTDQGLERHLLGSHGLVTSSMQEAANKGQDGGRCPVCGKVYQWKLLNHVAKDHNLTLKPAHLSYKCTVCTATFGMYKQFENHVYSAHSVVAKRTDKKGTTGGASGGGGASADSKGSSSQHLISSQSLLKPLKINDEITIIPQPVKSASSSSAAATTSTQSSRSASLVQHRINKKFMCQAKEKDVKCQKMKPGKVKV